MCWCPASFDGVGGQCSCFSSFALDWCSVFLDSASIPHGTQVLMTDVTSSVWVLLRTNYSPEMYLTKWPMLAESHTDPLTTKPHAPTWRLGMQVQWDPEWDPMGQLFSLVSSPSSHGRKEIVVSCHELSHLSSSISSYFRSFFADFGA